MLNNIPTWFIYWTPVALIIVGLVQCRIMTMRKRVGIRALEMTIEQFKDEKEYVAHAKRELEIARNKPFWKF